MIKELLVLVSEVVLSLYPTIIKTVDTSVFFQTGMRMFVFTALALLAAVFTGAPLPAIASKTTLFTGLLNLVHVGSSYTAFEKLAGGNAMSLFYTYPIFNILGAAGALGESRPRGSMPWIALAFLGALCVAQPSPSNWSMLGVGMALLAALTETGIYLWFKQSTDDKQTSTQPWTKMAQMYGSSGALWSVLAIVLLAVGFIGKDIFSVSARGLGGMIGFNSIVGFLGYALRFYLIPNVSTVTFSALSFFGVISAYIFGWIFSNELPTTLQMIGAAAIIVANAVLLKSDEYI
jgi:drug/metabolite transporter (DMT)-like permease